MTAKGYEHFHEVLASFDNAMLVTRARDGHLHSRPMALAETEPDSDLWFITSLETSKIDDIAADPNVNVALQTNDCFLSLTGRATVVDDRAKVNELWNESWRVWFPGGKEDPRIVLIRVEALEGEFWDNAGANRLRYLFKAGKAYLQGERPHLGSDLHDRVSLE